MLESKFQAHLITRLEQEFRGCVILKNDANYRQGFPDLLVLFENTWVALEVKRNATASHQPNQDYWVDKLDQMSFSTFIYPENEEEVFHALNDFYRAR